MGCTFPILGRQGTFGSQPCGASIAIMAWTTITCVVLLLPPAALLLIISKRPKRSEKTRCPAVFTDVLMYSHLHDVDAGKSIGSSRRSLCCRCYCCCNSGKRFSGTTVTPRGFITAGAMMSTLLLVSSTRYATRVGAFRAVQMVTVGGPTFARAARHRCVDTRGTLRDGTVSA